MIKQKLNIIKIIELNIDMPQTIHSYYCFDNDILRIYYITIYTLYIHVYVLYI